VAHERGNFFPDGERACRGKQVRIVNRQPQVLLHLRKLEIAEGHIFPRQIARPKKLRNARRECIGRQCSHNSVLPHTSQPGRRVTATLRNVMSRRSATSIFPSSGPPSPASTLIASTAPRHATAPATAPNTGNSRFHAAGSSGYRHARHGVRPGTTVV